MHSRKSIGKTIGEKKGFGMAKVVLDFAYLKTNGVWKNRDEPEPPAAEILATSLVMIDTDTLMFSRGVDAHEDGQRVCGDQRS